ncbi:MAG TPA: UbiX family flavin prenyltransferase [Thermoanaerobaculia bacterium]|nr:UbiX family flavin prenyltransferase [Thermoanaerobaculia bacterium]
MARIALLVTGASGMLLPIHALRAMVGLPALDRIHLVVSDGARQVLFHELGQAGESDGAAALVAAGGAANEVGGRVRLHADRELDAEIASGSYRLDATVILPCSSGTLGALASGGASTLVHRAGQVALKERWPLVLGFRETPLHLVHLENLRRLAYAGATILPPIPAFYVGGYSLDRFLDAYVLRVLDAARISVGEDAALGLRWEGGKRDGARRAR